MANSTASDAQPKAAPIGLLGVSVLLLAIQAWNIGQWITAFNQGHSQQERVTLYLQRLPAGLSTLDSRALTLLAVLFGTVAFVAAVVASARLKGRWRALTWTLAGFNGFLIAWYLFTLM
jgi:hypothetical protein